MNNFMISLNNTLNRTTTENGAETLAGTGSKVLDFFSMIGGERDEEPARYIKQFDAAYRENPTLAMKALFYTRDCRGGLGERTIFRNILRWMAANYPESAKLNLALISEYGRYDDLLCLLTTAMRNQVVSMIKCQLEADVIAASEDKKCSLLAKWLPSENASSPETKGYAHILINCMNLKASEYRKILSGLRKYIDIVESHITNGDYDSIDYSKLPGRALMKYRSAFMRHDGEKFFGYLDAVNHGKAKMNTSTLEPYDIVAKVGGKYDDLPSDEDRLVLDTAWRNLPDYTKGQNALVMLDGSGSMFGKPIEIGMSLAIYFAERNEGPFKDYFMTFSMNPRLVHIEGKDIAEKVQFCYEYNEMANTNVSAAFEAILRAAQRNKASADDMPKRLYIISDMEFDECVKGMTNFEYWKKMFEENGYELPQIVFWNVASRNNQAPVSMDERNCILVSGSAASTFSMVIEGDINPYKYMLSVLESERYAPVQAKEE